MKIAILGASGFAREVADIATALEAEDVVLLDRGVGGEEDRLFGLRLLHESRAHALAEEGFRFVVGVGHGSTRARIVEANPDLPYTSLVHPAATFGRDQRATVESQPGVIVAAGARFMSNITVGRFCVFSLNSTIGHDCVVEEFVTVMPGANISGNVHIGREAYLGTNSAVLQGASMDEKMRVGEGATIGASALVTRPVDSRTTVVGIPARAMDR